MNKKNAIIKKLEIKEISLGDLKTLLEKADQIELKIRDLKKKEVFWNEILKYILSKEKEEGRYYHKAPFYSRLAIKKLRAGKSYDIVLNYLRLAFKDAEKKYRGSEIIPEDLSHYRFSQILRCFLRYKNSRTESKKIIDTYLNDKYKRELINKALFYIYKLTLESPHILHLGWAHFDKLLGRNKYRVLVESNYRGALWICQKVKEIHRRTNLEQYGLALAVISLCGVTIEGILSHNKRIAKNIKNYKRGPITLGKLIGFYLDHCKPSPDLAVMLIFLLSIRNQIHPKNINNRFVKFDMILALFVFRLTEQIIIRMSSER